MSNVVPTTFLGAPVLSLIPNRVDQRQQPFDRRVIRFEVNSVGLDARAQDAEPFSEHTLEFIGMTRSEVLEIEAFVEARLGSYEAFWFPTWQFEFAVTALTATTFSWEDNGYLERLWPNRRWQTLSALGPNTTGGYDMRVFEVQVGDAANDGVVNTNTVAAGGTGWATMPPDAVLLSRLCYGRLKDDRVETQWKTFDAAVVTLNLIEVQR